MKMSIPTENSAASITRIMRKMCIRDRGDRVKHNVFGQGTVDEAKRMGNDTMLTISVDNGQVKKVMANFARIEKL